MHHSAISHRGHIGPRRSQLRCVEDPPGFCIIAKSVSCFNELVPLFGTDSDQDVSVDNYHSRITRWSRGHTFLLLALRARARSSPRLKLDASRPELRPLRAEPRA